MPDIEEILIRAREAGASDVHTAVGSPPGMRVDGILHIMDMPKLSAADTLEILLAVMTQMQRDKFEEYGEYELAVSLPRAGRCRVKAFKQQGETALSFRLTRLQTPSIEELGMPESIAGLCELKEGLILIAGASNQGKSTTLAAMVERINCRREVHILTLEKTLEYKHSYKKAIITQREYGQDFMDFTEALNHASGVDADVIMIDQIQDMNTLKAAVTAAKERLVIAAICGSDIRDAIESMTADFTEYGQQLEERLKKILQAVIVQKLQCQEDGQNKTFIYNII